MHVIRLDPLLQASIGVVLQLLLTAQHSIAIPRIKSGAGYGDCPRLPLTATGRLKGDGKYRSLSGWLFFFPFAAFLLAVRAPERIAMDGNVSFAKTGSFVGTVPNCALTVNRKWKSRWVAFFLVRFFVAVDKD